MRHDADIEARTARSRISAYSVEKLADIFDMLSS
jgi:hypothetical protein